MSIYRRKSSNGRRSRFYVAEFVFRGKVVRRSGFPDRESAKQWLSTESLRVHRTAVDYIKPMLAAEVAPLIKQFVEHLQSRGRDERYSYIMGQRLMRLAGECGWLVLGNVSRESLEKWANSEPRYRGKKIKPRTINQFVESGVEFGKWIAHPKVAKLPVNPLSSSDRLLAKHNDRYRRAGTEEELNALLASCTEGRRAEYLFRIYQSSIRRRTLQGLRWSMFHLDAAPPFIKVTAEIDKGRKEKKYVLRYDIAQQLRSEKKRLKAKADDLVFPSPATIDDLRYDLAKAGVRFSDADGNRRLDFHAFRRTLVKIGKRAGLSLDQVSLLLGHKDINTTRKYYDDDTVEPDLGTSMEKLPTLGQIRKAE